MKKKYYPAITLASAVAVTLVPLLLLLVGLNTRNYVTPIGDDPTVLSEANETNDAPIRLAEATSDKTPGDTVIDTPSTVAGTENPRSQGVTPQEQRPGVRPSSLTVPEVVLPQIGSVVSGRTDSGQRMAVDVPTPIEIVPEADPAFLVQTDLTAAEIAEIESENARFGIPARPNVGKSYYDATGHLAMVAVPQVADPLAGIQQNTSEKADATKKSPESKSRKDRTRKSKNDVMEPVEVVDTPVSAAAMFPELRTSDDGEVSPDLSALMEEVALQTPRDGTTVSRVEDVVAMTRAKGWPIALIKSDLPDDVWWVQQVVGIQGNAFAARVNFGNEYSIRGTRYHMVFVFLDSADEVRRFRIAKQFKDIPAGTRRSQEFNFIRN